MCLAWEAKLVHGDTATLFMFGMAHKAMLLQALRAILSWPLGSVDLLPACTFMYNLLGQADGEEGLELARQTMARAYKTPGAAMHWYDKEGCQRKRKIGHVNIIANGRPEACRRLDSVAPGALHTRVVHI